MKTKIYSIEQWIKECTDLNDKQKEVVIFGFKQGRFLFGNIVSMLFIGAMLNFFVEGIFYLLLFIPLRSFAGGYHADTKERCFWFSNVFYLCSLLLSKYSALDNKIIWIGSLLFALIIVFLSPIGCENKKIFPKKAKMFKMKTIFILFVEIYIAFTCRFLFNTHFLNLMFYVFASVLFLQICGLLKNKKKLQVNV